MQVSRREEGGGRTQETQAWYKPTTSSALYSLCFCPGHEAAALIIVQRTDRSGNALFSLVVGTVIHKPETLSGLFKVRGSAPPNSASLCVSEESEESEECGIQHTHICLLAPVT